MNPLFKAAANKEIISNYGPQPKTLSRASSPSSDEETKDLFRSDGNTKSHRSIAAPVVDGYQGVPQISRNRERLNTGEFNNEKNNVAPQAQRRSQRLNTGGSSGSRRSRRMGTGTNVDWNVDYSKPN